MTIVLFLVDSSASMAQKTYQGTTLLDNARIAIELFLKQRSRDANARGDRYMLMSFEEFPLNVKCGWREGQGVFQEQLKSLKPSGLTTFGPALGSAFRFLNINRLQSGIDNYGCGRYPYYLEPVVIVSLTDGNSLTCPLTGTAPEIKFSKPTAQGNELTEEPFRWDQRLFALVLRIPGCPSKSRFTPGTPLPSDNSPIDAMCVATGGRSFCVTSHKMLALCVEAIVQKMQFQGVLVHFDKVGADPPPLIPERANGVVENGLAKRNGDVDGVKRVGLNENGVWKSVLTTVFSRSQRLGHWPIPEAFWPDRNMVSLPPRKAHPQLTFRCEASEPLVCQDFPFDKYELEPSPLTQFILERRQPNVCWQVFVSNSHAGALSAAPFGYLKAATNLQSVNLFVMPYNYPQLLPLIDEFKQDPKAKSSASWKSRLEKYLICVPSYYLQPLKKALARLNISSPFLDLEQGQQYSYSILSYLTKMKHTAREEHEGHLGSIDAALHALPPPVTQVNVTSRKFAREPERGSSQKKKSARLSEAFPGYMVQVGERRLRPAPSMLFRNPFEIKREGLLDQLSKMRVNLSLHLTDGHLRVLEGGRPGTNIKLQHAEDLHSLPVSQMGNYQEYVKGLEAIGRGPLKEVEPQAIRIHAFGNPFKIDKKNMAVDEVGDGNFLGSAAKVDAAKKQRSSSAASSSVEVGRPPRRKPGPLAADAISQWRRRRREWSSSSSVASSSDLESISSLDSDLESADSRSVGSVSGGVRWNSPGTSKENEPLVNGHASLERRLSGGSNSSSSLHSLPAKKPRIDDSVRRLDEDTLRHKKLLVGNMVRRLGRAEKVVREVISEVETVSSPADRRACLQFAIREATRFKRLAMLSVLSDALKNLSSSTSSTAVSRSVP